ncbi:MAG TPA: SDR family oxidoreductase [Spirochaetia bacterium]|nr:SDR family oxidoreductase [Spirochaetia bacterium]
MRLEGKAALVTGGSQGIGRGIAEAFAREGARVAVNFRTSGEAASELVEEIRAKNGTALALEGDVSSEKSVHDMIERVTQEFGRIDILVNNAGTSSSAPVLELGLSELRRVFETNVFGLFHISQLAAKKMIAQGEGGAILNVSSLVASRPFLNISHYNASKAAVSAFTQSMALELGRYGIRVNEICPASVETGMTRKALQDPENVKMRKRTIPLGRIGRPEDLGGAAVFLCSEEASWITGVSIFTDGGLSLIPPFGPPS